MDKIVFFINSLENSGGTERVSVALANNLVEKGYDVSFVCWQKGTRSFFKISDKIKVYALFEGKINIYTQYLQSVYRFYKIIRFLKPKIIIDVCVSLSLVSLPLKKILNFKIISWEHFNTEVNWEGKATIIARNLVSKFSDLVVVLTKTDLENYKIKYRGKNIICIPNPYTLKSEEKSNIQSKNIITIGRLTYQKGFDILIEIWEKIAFKKPDWNLTIVGNGELRESLLRDINSRNLGNSIKLIEPTTEISEYYLNASVFVMTSRFEGLPLVLLEAKAFGLPIISFDCPTGPRDIILDGKNGFLIKDFNKEEFESKLISLIESEELRQKFQNGAKLNFERFETETIFETWENNFKKLLS